MGDYNGQQNAYNNYNAGGNNPYNGAYGNQGYNQQQGNQGYYNQGGANQGNQGGHSEYQNGSKSPDQYKKNSGQEFNNYMFKTIDPGQTLLIGTAIICGLLFMATLAVVAYVKRRQRRRGAKKLLKLKMQEQEALEALGSGENVDYSDFIPQNANEIFEKRVVKRDGRRVVSIVQALEKEQDKEFPTGHKSDPVGMFQKDLLDDGGVVDQLHTSVRQGDFANCGSVADTQSSKSQGTDPQATDPQASDDYVLMWKENPFQEKKEMDTCAYLCRMMKLDRESRALLKLAIPYSLTSIIENGFGLATLALVGQLLGTRELTAYVTVYYAVGLTTMFLEGILSAITTVCSQAIGSGRYALAGQYVQIATLLYKILYIPQIILWWKYMYAFMIWLEFDQDMALVAQSYSRVYLFYILMGISHESLVYLLEVCGHETYVAVSTTLHSVAAFFVTLFVLLIDDVPYWGKPNLQLVAYIDLVIGIGFLLFDYRWASHMGWLDRYNPGMIGSFALGNTKTVQNFIQVSFPLSCGYVLSYGEWEILFILASMLGPAEVAAWGILGEIWEGLEGLTTAWAEAAEVRCGYLLGSGDYLRAQLSSYKSILMGCSVATFMSVLLVLFMEELPPLITDDVTLQQLIEEVLPLLALANVTLALGTISWQLVGAQNRYTLATAIELVGSWFVTLPLAILSSLVWRLNLTGLVASLVIGCAVSGMMNYAVVRCTKWEKISAKLMHQNKVLDGDYESESSSSEDEEGGNYTNPTVEMSTKELQPMQPVPPAAAYAAPQAPTPASTERTLLSEDPAVVPGGENASIATSEATPAGVDDIVAAAIQRAASATEDDGTESDLLSNPPPKIDQTARAEFLAKQAVDALSDIMHPPSVPLPAEETSRSPMDPEAD